MYVLKYDNNICIIKSIEYENIDCYLVVLLTGEHTGHEIWKRKCDFDRCILSITNDRKDYIIYEIEPILTAINR
jgi:hypothetical protein